jgi:NAD(P)-dependent dehydrogenase (short-subunit alcohol dehydrogenase family)
MRTALVTGGARRIGRAIVERLAAEGYAVAIHCHRSDKEAHALRRALQAKGARMEVVAADLCDPAMLAGLVRQARAALGSLTLLVNNASAFEPDDIQSLEEALWERHFRINLRAPVFLARDFAAQAPDDCEGRSSMSSTSESGSRTPNSSPTPSRRARCLPRHRHWRRRSRRGSGSMRLGPAPRLRAADSTRTTLRARARPCRSATARGRRRSPMPCFSWRRQGASPDRCWRSMVGSISRGRRRTSWPRRNKHGQNVLASVCATGTGMAGACAEGKSLAIQQ